MPPGGLGIAGVHRHRRQRGPGMRLEDPVPTGPGLVERLLGAPAGTLRIARRDTRGGQTQQGAELRVPGLGGPGRPARLLVPAVALATSPNRWWTLASRLRALAAI